MREHHTTAQAPFGPAPPTEGLRALRRRLTTRGGRNHPPQPYTPIYVYPPLSPPHVVDNGLVPGQTTPPVLGGGRRGPGAATLELSFRFRLLAHAHRSLQKPNLAWPALTCQAATATAASILGLSACFLVESASTTPLTFTIGATGLSPLFLLDWGHACQGKTGGMWVVFRIGRGCLKRQGLGQIRTS